MSNKGQKLRCETLKFLQLLWMACMSRGNMCMWACIMKISMKTYAAKGVKASFWVFLGLIFRAYFLRTNFRLLLCKWFLELLIF